MLYTHSPIPVIGQSNAQPMSGADLQRETFSLLEAIDDVIRRYNNLKVQGNITPLLLDGGYTRQSQEGVPGIHRLPPSDSTSN